MAVQSNTAATTKTASVVVQSVNSTPQTGSISGKKSTGMGETFQQQVSSTLKSLSTVNPRSERETVTCAHYFLATKILCRNSALERELSAVVPDSAEAVRNHIESGLLTMFLPRHRVAAMKLAIEKNGIVGSYVCQALFHAVSAGVSHVPLRGVCYVGIVHSTV
ncbi:hypothetical protein BWQ96_09680 [Gracilariopsis chorda]|uniref:Uncharacterized protein n=1 Tax=Gracilariopsis chorda TaxID=448386 RepID=A0A2V3IF14_9FLOR|nr:hypothetical protein BWQ96_09680 [Gracilariopsis chorda]|eukprot:PXF40608.1 hypothetical protein BWQ96_09680 [Gracilariopsis chorda]